MRWPDSAAAASVADGAANGIDVLSLIPNTDRRCIVTLNLGPALSWPPFTENMNNLCYQDGPIPDPWQGTTEIWEFVKGDGFFHGVERGVLYLGGPGP